MLPAIHPAAHHSPTDSHVVSCLGNYTLLQTGDGEYELHGPDDRCPTDWIVAHLPAGEWWTEWAGEADAFVCRISS